MAQDLRVETFFERAGYTNEERKMCMDYLTDMDIDMGSRTYEEWESVFSEIMEERLQMVDVYFADELSG